MYGLTSHRQNAKILSTMHRRTAKRSTSLSRTRSLIDRANALAVAQRVEGGGCPVMPGTKSSGTAVPDDGQNRTQNRPRTTSHLLAGAVNQAEEVAAVREAEQGAEREEVPGEVREEVQSVQEGVDGWRPEAGRSRVFPTACLYCGVPPGLGYILCHISSVRFSCLSMLICH